MCGITGFIHFNRSQPASRTTLEKMTTLLKHRGPDGEGFFVKNNLALGHRRLSIIDLVSGNQPMFNDDKSIVIVFNGEIYNYIELREELKSLGHVFFTDSDTEVIIRSYEQWGTRCQNKLNGMWAFALWDDKEQQLFLSRDRLGEKPLNYSAYQNTFVFGSEIKSILSYGVPKSMKEEMVEIYLWMGYVPAPYTFYKGIYKLLPGHYLIIKDGNIQQHTYWNAPDITEKEMRTDEERVLRKFSELFVDSVKIRMRSDVPYGAFLSGGLDSSSVVAMMTENSNQPVETFTIGFQNKSFDERALAQKVANKFKTNHHEHLVLPESFDESLTRLLFHYDEPFGDASAIPTGYVAKYAREKVKMVLTGDGGDEMLSGYTNYQGEKFAAQYQLLPLFIQKSVPYMISRIASPFTGKIRYQLNRAKRILDFANTSFEKRLISKMALIEKPKMQSLIPPDFHYLSIEDYISDAMKNCTFNDPFYRLMYFHLNVSLPDDMLVKVDRMSMAYSLETRVPFLDYRIVELLWGVHKNIKLPGYNRKNILKKTIGKKLPEALLHAPKKGFNVPLREWFKDNSFEKRLQELYQTDFGLNASIIKDIVMANKRGEKDYGDFIWRLFVLRNWKKT